MPQVTIRRVEGDELLSTALKLTNYAFSPTPPMRTLEEMQPRLASMQENTALVLFEDDEPMATATSLPMSHTVRGTLYSLGGIAGVASHPNGRRKGYAYRVLEKMLETDRENGCVFSGLYPFRESFYGRLGFITYPQVKITKFAPQSLSSLLKMDFGGEVNYYPHQTVIEAYVAFLKRMQPRIHGMARVADSEELNGFNRNPVWIVLARVDGEVVGAMTYKIEQYGGKMSSYYFYYENVQARYLLLQFLARHVDQVGEVELTLPPYEMPETWLPDLNAKISTTTWVTPMGRVLDVAQIGGMQVGEGSFTARVIDPQCAWNNGVFRFESSGGVLLVSPAQEADCELTINGFSALIYGTHDPEEFSFRGWGNVSSEVQTIIREMFPRLLPHMHAPY